jgi:hypothetical protein
LLRVSLRVKRDKGEHGCQPLVDAAGKGMRSAALTAVNEPARQGRWAVRSVYKGCKKFMVGPYTL